MKNDSADAQQGLLAWAIDMAVPIKNAIDKGYPIHMLADHIKSYKDTEAFIEAFNDDKFGQCRQTFTEGPQYWKRIPHVREDWRKEGLEDNRIV